MNQFTTRQLVAVLALAVVAVGGTVAYYHGPDMQPLPTAMSSRYTLGAATALVPTLPVTPSFTPIVHWPGSTANLSYGGDLDLNLLLNQTYFANSADAQIVTSFRVDKVTALPNYNPQTYLRNLFATYLNANPETLIGSYLSGGDCLYAEAIKYHYANAISCEAVLAAVGPQWAAQALLPYDNNKDSLRRRVNIAIPQVRDAFIALIVNEGVSRNLPFLYVDNIIHPSSGGFRNTAITFTDQIDLITKVRTGLADRGMRAVFNIALSPASLTGAYAADAVKMQAAAGDGGYSFELAFHPNIRNKQADLTREINFYRQLLSAGQLVLLVPAYSLPTLEDRLIDLQALAAYAMMIKPETDSSLFVAKLGYWLSPGDFAWTHWPEMLGDPRGDYRFTDGGSLTRSFVRGTLTLNPVTREVAIDFYKSTPEQDVIGLLKNTMSASFEDQTTNDVIVQRSLSSVPPVTPTAEVIPAGGGIAVGDPVPPGVLVPNKNLTISYGGGGFNAFAQVMTANKVAADNPAPQEVKAAVDKITSILTDLIVYLQKAKINNQKPDYAKLNKLLEQIIQVLSDVKRYTK